MSDKLIRLLQKVQIRNIDHTVQIYGSKEYHGYYIRGRLLEEGCYRIAEFALINKSSFRANDGEHYENEVFGTFDTATIDQFLKERESFIYKRFIETYPDKVNQARKLCKTQRSFPQLKKILERLNDHVEINIKDLEIAESQYLKLSIKNKSKYIFFKKLVFPRKDELKSSNRHIYPLLTTQGFDDNPLLARSLLGKSSYLYDIGILSDLWLEKHNVTPKGMQLLSNLYKLLNNNEDPCMEYYLTFLNDLVSDLKTNKIIKQCLKCGNFFRYHPTKERCNTKSGDEENCAKSVNNRKGYVKYIEKRRLNARKQVKEQRECLKKYNVKK